MLKNLILCVCGFAVTGGFAVAVRALAARAGQSAFTIVTELIQTANGNETARETHVYARRSDGSFAMIRQVRDGKHFGNKVIYDVPNQRRLAIVPSLNAITTYNLTRPELKSIEARSAQCASQGGSEMSQHLGYPVVHRVYRESFGDEETVTDEWLAPQFACFPMKKVFSVRRNNTEVARNTYTVISVFPGDPDPAQFEIPDTLVEMAPSEVLRLLAQKTQNRACTQCEERTSKELDAIYNAYSSRLK